MWTRPLQQETHLLIALAETACQYQESVSELTRNDEIDRTVDKPLAGDLSPKRSGILGRQLDAAWLFLEAGTRWLTWSRLSHTHALWDTQSALLLPRGLSPHPQKTLNRVLMSVEND